jgi:hypothetical protein
MASLKRDGVSDHGNSQKLNRRVTRTAQPVPLRWITGRRSVAAGTTSAELVN